MRGQGRVFRPKARGRKTAIWWWDYTVRGCACGECDGNGRHREASGLRYPTATTADVFELMRHRKAERSIGRPPQPQALPTLLAFTKEHLKAKLDSGLFTSGWLKESRHQLDRAIMYFGGARHLESITVADVRGWAAHLQRRVTGGTARHHLNTLSNLYRRAQAEGLVSPGYNPVAALMEKPRANRTEARWLEVPDAALLLETARRHRARRKDLAMPFAYPLLATFLLTGGRMKEVLGLEVGDVSLDRRTVTFRPNSWRRLKTANSLRVVPLWPQLEAILRPHVFNSKRPPSQLLFPSYRTGKEAMLTDFRKLLRAVATRAGWCAREITSKMFRHTYCAARLQTLDAGAPVSVFTVARELGHGGDAMVKQVYGHLGTIRHRADVVEYRVEQHRAKLKSRLARLASEEDVCHSNGKHRVGRKVLSR